MDRYDRQIDLDNIGIDGQRKLADSRVLIAGLGGLGSPVAMYLASAGVGHIGLLDHDKVSVTDLNRQILYSESDIGKQKVQCVYNRLTSLNDDISYNIHDIKLTDSNVLDILPQYDIVLSCVDSYATRYIINQACVQLNKHLIDGAIEGYSGYVVPIVPRITPCYNCLFPEMTDSNDTKVVLGAAVGIVGSIMAIECIKHILDSGSDLIGSMLVIDTYTMDVNKVEIDINLKCNICS